MLQGLDSIVSCVCVCVCVCVWCKDIVDDLLSLLLRDDEKSVVVTVHYISRP